MARPTSPDVRLSARRDPRGPGGGHTWIYTGWLSDGISRCTRARLTRWVGRKRTGLGTSTIEMSHARRSTMTTTNARLGSRNSTGEGLAHQGLGNDIGTEHDARVDFGVGAPDER